MADVEGVPEGRIENVQELDALLAGGHVQVGRATLRVTCDACKWAHHEDILVLRGASGAVGELRMWSTREGPHKGQFTLCTGRRPLDRLGALEGQEIKTFQFPHVPSTSDEYSSSWFVGEALLCPTCLHQREVEDDQAFRRTVAGTEVLRAEADAALQRLKDAEDALSTSPLLQWAQEKARARALK